jgi:DNA-binding response OmpR family regulator
MVLESRGYQVITAQDGIEGLACLKAEKPDLMILDLLMPKMDGFGVMKELRDPRWAEFSEMPILIQTAVREEASRRRYELETGVALGAADYVEKPASPDILLARVKKLIKRK